MRCGPTPCAEGEGPRRSGCVRTPARRGPRRGARGPGRPAGRRPPPRAAPEDRDVGLRGPEADPRHAHAPPAQRGERPRDGGARRVRLHLEARRPGLARAHPDFGLGCLHIAAEGAQRGDRQREVAAGDRLAPRPQAEPPRPRRREQERGGELARGAPVERQVLTGPRPRDRSQGPRRPSAQVRAEAAQGSQEGAMGPGEEPGASREEGASPRRPQPREHGGEAEPGGVHPELDPPGGAPGSEPRVRPPAGPEGVGRPRSAERSERRPEEGHVLRLGALHPELHRRPGEGREHEPPLRDRLRGGGSEARPDRTVGSGDGEVRHPKTVRGRRRTRRSIPAPCHGPRGPLG
jgi:hypothetical protein